MCGSVVEESATECPGCGEPFAVAEAEITEEPAIAEAEPLDSEEPAEAVPDEGLIEEDDGLIEEEIESFDEEEIIEPEPAEEEKYELSVGCPICGSSIFSVESGDLVSCNDCGNVYIKKEFEGICKENWKIKFWLGLIFIIVGDIGVALGSYVHNIYHWSPLGDLYLGYGWMDQAVGILGIVLFVVGLILFVWSFKRERIVQCPSCKVFICEGQLNLHEEREEEEAIPEANAIETAMEEIGEGGECPHCGAMVSIYDAVCPNCESAIEDKEVVEEVTVEEIPPAEPEPEAEPESEEYSTASEFDETTMVLESLELIEEEVKDIEEQPADENNGLIALQELEAEFEISELEEEIEGEEKECPECGMLIDKGASSCPICGVEISSGE